MKAQKFTSAIVIAIAAVVVLLSSCGSSNRKTTENVVETERFFNPNINYDTLTDPRDNKTYRTVRIGDLIWIAENLNFTMNDSWCYDNDASNCEKYGRLYNWDAAMTACPDGWRLSTHGDWRHLWNAVGGLNNSATKLRSTSGWIYDPDNGYIHGTNNIGFSALPGGIRRIRFAEIGYAGSWWLSTVNWYLPDGLHNADDAMIQQIKTQSRRYTLASGE